MPEYFTSDAAAPASPAALRDSISATDERILWSGLCAVAEYAFDEPASLPRWTLPEETEVVVTDQRVLYRGPGAPDTGELRWPWPQHLRVQPGSRETGRQATVTQIQLVCAGPGGTFPALVFAGGDLTTVRDADRLANTLRQAIARYRVEHAAQLGIPALQVRMLSRLVIGPEFTNFQGGEGQTVSLLGSVSVETYGTPTSAAPAPSSGAPAWDAPTAAPAWDAPTAAPAWDAPAASSAPAPTSPAWGTPAAVSPSAAPSSPAPGWEAPTPAPAQDARPGYATVSYPPVVAGPPATPQREAWSARPADETALNGHPDLDARAAELAARVASLVAGGAAPLGGRPVVESENQANLSAYLDVPPATAPQPRAGTGNGGESDISDRAESVRRTAARFAGNAARGRSSAARYDGEVGSSGRGSHRQG
ncbi:translation initiation factor 2 [Actinoplanes sp. URMC 104]|uniref:translation initiation factor 2 n=1 Tax=Actinoplanes sp. URMC 104 TaxID=3423409 RepID=UPI003F1BCD74